MAVLTFRYKVEAMDFIVKDEIKTLPDRICACIKNAENNYKTQLNSSNRLLSVKVDKTSLILDQDDIVAITTCEENHKIMIHTKNGVRQMAGSLKELNAILNSTFFQCSRSVIVNMKHLLKYSKEDAVLTMDNKETYNVSIRMMGKLQKALKQI